MLARPASVILGGQDVEADAFPLRLQGPHLCDSVAGGEVKVLKVMQCGYPRKARIRNILAVSEIKVTKLL